MYYINLQSNRNSLYRITNHLHKFVKIIRFLSTGNSHSRPRMLPTNPNHADPRKTAIVHYRGTLGKMEPRRNDNRAWLSKAFYRSPRAAAAGLGGILFLTNWFLAAAD